MGTIIHLVNSTVTVVTVLYYWLIYNYWIPIQIVGGIFTFLGIAGVYFAPESPKFLIS